MSWNRQFKLIRKVQLRSLHLLSSSEDVYIGGEWEIRWDFKIVFLLDVDSLCCYCGAVFSFFIISSLQSTSQGRI